MLTRPITVSVVSDLGLVAAGLRSLLANHTDRIEVIDSDRPLDAETPVDVVLVDPTGRTEIDVQLMERLARNPRIGHLAVYATGVSRRTMAEAYRIGVRSFLSKSLNAADLAAALIDIATGTAVEMLTSDNDRASWIGRDDGLTERESQVLVLCADGLSNREIADALYVNVETIKSHLKHAYSRLGLRNRAQAAAYVHRVGGPNRALPLDWHPAGEAGARRVRPRPESARFDDIAPDAATLADRLRVMGLDDAARQRLARYTDAVETGAASFVQQLASRWASHEHTAPLVDEPAVRARLVEHQRRYLIDLFGGRYDVAHALAMLHTGATHHRIRLSPQWYLTSYVHVVCDHLEMMFTDADDDEQSVEAVIALLGSVLFDAGLVLDAYELSVADEILREVRPQREPNVGIAPAAMDVPEPSTATRRRPIAKVALADQDETSARRRFIGLDEEVVVALRSLTDHVDAAMPDVLAGFYELVATTESVASFMTPEVAAKLRIGVAAFWRDSTTSTFDRSHAASRMRVGVIHEQVGLPPQYYLAGVVRQLAGLLRALVRRSEPSLDVRREVDALVRVAFFDMSFVLDAYLDARAASLLQTGQFAGQVVTGLANGVAIVDARDRIEYANEHLLGLAGVSAAVLRRIPVEAALPLEGIVDLLDAARRSVAGRASTLHRLRGRHLRVTALRVHRTTGADGQVAIVVDDISDVVRASAELEHEDRRFAHVLAAVHAVAWEIDGDTLTVMAVSRAAEVLTGVRDIDFLGRPMLIELVHPDDRARVSAAWSGLRDGEHVQTDHRIVRPDGDIRWMRSSAVGSVEPTGSRTVSGVSVDVTDVQLELEQLRRAVGPPTV